MAAYQTAQQKYQQALEAWRNSHPDLPNPNGISASEVQQRLTLGREPQATLTIVSTDGTRDDNFQWPNGWDGADGEHPTMQQLMSHLSMDSNSFATFKWNGGTSGEVTVDYNNLQNSTYTDNNGQTHHISRIRVTYLLDTSSNEHGLTVFSDITDGLGYLNTNGVSATYTLYGDDGQPLDLSAGHAYITVTSLNNHPGGIETVSGGQNTKSYAILGSSVSNHNDELYADSSNDGTVNADGSLTPGTHNNNWDKKGSPYEYFGAGIIEATNNNFTLHYGVKNVTFDAPAGQGDGPWATITATVLATPGPTYDGPDKPTLDTTEVHYSQRCNFLKSSNLPSFTLIRELLLLLWL